MTAKEIHDRIESINNQLKCIDIDTDEAINLYAEREDLLIKLDAIYDDSEIAFE